MLGKRTRNDHVRSFDASVAGVSNTGTSLPGSRGIGINPKWPLTCLPNQCARERESCRKVELSRVHARPERRVASPLTRQSAGKYRVEFACATERSTRRAKNEIPEAGKYGAHRK